MKKKGKKINYRKKIDHCFPGQLFIVLNEIEDDPLLPPKKKSSLKIRIAKRSDVPENVLKELERQEKGEINYWIHEARRERELENTSLKII